MKSWTGAKSTEIGSSGISVSAFVGSLDSGQECYRSCRVGSLDSGQDCNRSCRAGNRASAMKSRPGGSEYPVLVSRLPYGQQPRLVCRAYLSWI